MISKMLHLYQYRTNVQITRARVSTIGMQLNYSLAIARSMTMTQKKDLRSSYWIGCQWVTIPPRRQWLFNQKEEHGQTTTRPIRDHSMTSRWSKLSGSAGPQRIL